MRYYENVEITQSAKIQFIDKGVLQIKVKP